MKEQALHKPVSHFRLSAIWMAVLLISAGLLWRGFDLHVLRKDFLQHQGDARAMRIIPVAAHRGMIVDRHGEPLAVSTPVDSIWLQPKQFAADKQQLRKLAKLLSMHESNIRNLVTEKSDKEFVYLKRRIHPALTQKVMDLEIQGLSSIREYRRYYPAGEVASHVVGFTNVDDIGQEGIELAFNNTLTGTEGSRLVMRDSLGRVVKDVDLIKAPRPGQDLILSLDRRLQYLAYRELKRAVLQNKARSGSAVILDIHTGEVLAMVNQPSFNPNNRSELKGYRYRNRVVTDTFEPGSTMKPFTVIAALESRQFNRKSIIDTRPGFLQIGSNTVKDIRNYGLINLTTVLQKSSNVAASKIALSLKPHALWEMFQRLGFGDLTGSGFPGEVTGTLNIPRVSRDIERATLSYGYGLSVTTLQLARAYAVIANGGMLQPISFQLQTDAPAAQQIIEPKYTTQVRHMLQSVIAEGGTGTKAQVPGYQVAGKTGTVKKVGRHGYSDDKYVAAFVGFAPASNPRLVMAVTIHEPRGEHYYGGEVAAPVFSKVMSGALRLMDINPDDMSQHKVQLANAEGRL